MNQTINSSQARKIVSNVWHGLNDIAKKKTLRRIDRILREKQSPDTRRAESHFSTLQAKYAPLPEYGYDPISTWKRASWRANELLSLPGLDAPGKKGLDIGTGDGMLGVTLNAFGHETTLLDQEDWRDPRARQLPFIKMDSCTHLPFPDGTFDFACSYNSFEHLAEPQAALREMVRVVRPGGYIHLDFGPVYSSPWGLHAYRSFRMPYPQFLFSDDFIHQMLEKMGIWDLGKKRTELQYLNKVKVREFDSIWNDAQCVVVHRHIECQEYGLPLVLEYPEAFSGRDLTVEDLISDHIRITLKKP